MELLRTSNHNLFNMKPWKRNQHIKLIYPVFRVICVVMTVIMLVTAGEFLMGTTSEFVANVFVMTKQRFPD